MAVITTRLDPGLTKRIRNVPPIDYREEYEDAPVVFIDEDGCCPTAGHYTKACCCDFCAVMVDIFFVVLMFLAPVLVFLSLYLAILILYSFFTAALVSYIFAPVFGVLSRNWLDAITSIFRLALCSPLLAFLIIFMIRSVKGFGESGLEILRCLAKLAVNYVALYARRLKTSQYTEDASNQECNMPRIWGVVRFLIIDVILLVIFLAFAEVAAFWGILLIPVIIQLICICIPIYAFWGKMLLGYIPSKTEHCSDVARFLQWKVNDIERREKLEDIQLGLLNDEDSSSDSSDGAYPARVEWPGCNDARKCGRKCCPCSCCQTAPVESSGQRELGWLETLFEAWDFSGPIRSLFLASQYTGIYFWAEKIADAQQPVSGRNDRLDRSAFRPRDWVLRVVSGLNLIFLVIDIVQAGRFKSWGFLGSALFRLLILPMLSFFHLAVGFMFGKECKDALLKWVNIICAVLTGVVFIVLMILLIYFGTMNNILQLTSDLHGPSAFNDSYVLRDVINPICTLSANDVPIWELIGYALGPYEYKRDPTLFNNQMQYFFGKDWATRITIESETFSEFPVMIYHDSLRKATIMGLRGAASGSELTLQVEMFIWLNVLPALNEIAPFYEILTAWRVPLLSRKARDFGNTFFDTRTVPRRVVDPVLEYFDRKELQNENVVLSGIGTGGAIAKTIGMLRKQRAFAFWGLPVFEESYRENFGFDDMDAIYVTNIFNYDGLVTAQEPQIADNFGVPWIPGSGITRDTRYRSFCTLFTMCAKGGMLSEYCDQAVADMADVRDAFSEQV